MNSNFSLAVHGGAGTISRNSMTPEQEKLYHQALRDAVQAGVSCLENGGDALEAVTRSVEWMENCELFNAGKGAVFTSNGEHELDASIMCGATLKAGAVSGLRHIANPIRLAKAVLVDGEFVFLSGAGAEEFATRAGFEKIDNSYFNTDFRKSQLQQARQDGVVQLDHAPIQGKKYGTVGAVARDSSGNLAAATSTGGMTNKRFGRVGDTPVIGAGTYAHNDLCAVSCTGYGEYFLRTVAAHAVAQRMRWANQDLETAARAVIFQDIQSLGGDGGLIAVNNSGSIVMPFNTPGMYRAAFTASTGLQSHIYLE